jgi:hypothetical protein
MGSLSQSGVAGCMSEVRIGNRIDDGVLHQVQGLGQLCTWLNGVEIRIDIELEESRRQGRHVPIEQYFQSEIML